MSKCLYIINVQHDEDYDYICLVYECLYKTISPRQSSQTNSGKQTRVINQ